MCGGWHTPIVPATKEVEEGGLRFKVIPSKVSPRSYLKTKSKLKGPGTGGMAQVAE
jgi:hypothetical protein